MKTKLYLVTGFLGAGKTTFLKKFIPALAPMRMHIIVNEFGKEGVDGPLLETIGASLKQISNGSIFCSCRIDEFEDELQNSLDNNPDCIVVEASGLADPTNIRAIVGEKKYNNKIQYCGGICLVDANRFKKVYSTARCVKKQIAASDIVFLNKIDKANKEKIVEVEKLVHMQRPDIPIYKTIHGEFEMKWIQNLILKDNVELNYKSQIPDITLQKMMLKIDEKIKYDQLLYFLNLIVEDTYRIKGFVKVEGVLYLVNCVGTMINVEPYYQGKEVNIGQIVVLSGEGLPLRKTIMNAISKYEGLFSIIK
ncbi:CobW family GTP-binding protein [Maledivibacter halophilus]|uniref:GTPase, G3E family n=1 Tax=Maledivibacter halophilus TaxID=36842 RepID=A0A1T5LME3_9FIRM|nr:GTP-binding protein [Maledivibacter halophilus]SKC77122.1 GTPase, G3E family [Maledivibacter halophilus]